MIKYVCDCCGKEIERKDEIKQIKVFDNETNKIEKEGIHWCKDCVSKNGNMDLFSYFRYIRNRIRN